MPSNGWLTADLPSASTVTHSSRVRVLDDAHDPLACGHAPASVSHPSFAVGLRPLRETRETVNRNNRTAEPPRTPPPKPAATTTDENERFKAEVEAEIAAEVARDRAEAAALTAAVAAEARAACEAATPKTLSALLADRDLTQYQGGMQQSGLSLVQLLRATRGDGGNLDSLLREGGVTRLGHRMRLANALRAMAASA